MIEKARTIEDGPRRQHMVQAIANFMKMAYVTWNKDSVADETILSDLRILSKDELQLEENINLNRVEYRTPVAQNTNRPRAGSNQNQNNKGGRQNNNNNPRHAQNNNRNRTNNNNPGGRKF